MQPMKRVAPFYSTASWLQRAQCSLQMMQWFIRVRSLRTPALQCLTLLLSVFVRKHGHSFFFPPFFHLKPNLKCFGCQPALVPPQALFPCSPCYLLMCVNSATWPQLLACPAVCFLRLGKHLLWSCPPPIWLLHASSTLLLHVVAGSSDCEPILFLPSLLFPGPYGCAFYVNQLNHSILFIVFI